MASPTKRLSDDCAPGIVGTSRAGERDQQDRNCWRGLRWIPGEVSLGVTVTNGGEIVQPDARLSSDVGPTKLLAGVAA